MRPRHQWRPKSPINETLAQRLARYITRAGEQECWEWNGFKNTLGYGRAWWRGTLYLAHRLAWIEANGPIPADMKVLHRCDNPPCCNPTHLFLGTDADNARDRDRKGRLGDRRGEANGHASLSAQQVKQLRKFSGSHAEAGRQFKISDTHVARVRSGAAWPHIK